MRSFAKTTAFLGLLIFIFVVSPEALSPKFKWAKEEKVRAWYTRYVGEKSDIPQAAKAGFNLALLYSGGTWIKETMTNAEINLELAKKYGVRVVLYFYPASSQHFIKFNPVRPYIDKEGKTVKFWKGIKSCPVGKETWGEESGFALQALNAARLSLEWPNTLVGIIFDVEPMERNYCFCDLCLKDFFRWEGAKREIKDDLKVYSWLKKKGLLERYNAWQREQLYLKARELKEKVHAINPDFSIGLGMWADEYDEYNEDDWYFDSLLKGFSTERAPSFIFSWTTYYTGYSRLGFEKNDPYDRGFSRINRIKRHMTELLGYLPFYLPAINPRASWRKEKPIFRPEEAAREMYLMDLNALGSVVYDEWPPITEEYWRAYKDAHIKLDKVLGVHK
jgi:hypothetical protein